MATSYKTPGVYVEEISVFPPSVAQVETAIPAFVGYTEKAPDTEPVRRIESLKEFVYHYGGAKQQAADVTVSVDATTGLRSVSIAAGGLAPVALMYYQLRMYFENGGGPCYIISVGQWGNGNPDIKKNEISDAIKKLELFDEPTLIVIVDAKKDDDRLEHMQEALQLAGKMQDRFAILDVPESKTKEADVDWNFGAFRTGIGSSKLSYGAAYYPPLHTTLVPITSDASLKIKYNGHAANNRTLESILNGQFKPAPNDNEYAHKPDEALYRELKTLIDTEIAENHTLTLLPSGAVAGIYAQVDANRGVWKAPANVSINNVKDVQIKVTDSRQMTMNVHADTGKSINAIRMFYGKGTLIWGGRTLAGNDNEWRYINVRRFYNMVEESVKKATFPFVFEPNNANTWVKVRAMIENFLTLQWRAGALAGAKAEDAFFVRVGLGQTMDANDILEGRMIVEIGMAAVRPAEFIILRFSHMMQQS